MIGSPGRGATGFVEVPGSVAGGGGSVRSPATFESGDAPGGPGRRWPVGFRGEFPAERVIL